MYSIVISPLGVRLTWILGFRLHTKAYHLEPARQVVALWQRPQRRPLFGEDQIPSPDGYCSSSLCGHPNMKCTIAAEARLIATRPITKTGNQLTLSHSILPPSPRFVPSDFFDRHQPRGSGGREAANQEKDNSPQKHQNFHPSSSHGPM